MGKKGKKDKGKGRVEETTSRPVHFDDEEVEVEEEVQPRFTYNNRPHFPTSHTTSWNYTFKIELGEERYKVDEVSGDNVLSVHTRYTQNLSQFLSTRTAYDVAELHGNIRCVANVTRELCKGIIKAFDKLMRNSREDEPMWLDNHYNYRLCGLEPYQDPPQYPLIKALDNFSSPVEVIIIKEDQTGVSQRSLESKLKSIRKILELLYPKEFRNKEWDHMINYLSKDNYNDNCCNGLPLSEHWLFWHWDQRIEFIKYCHNQLVKEEKQILQVFSGAFSNMSFLDSNWENVFRTDLPLDKVWTHHSGTVSQRSASNVAVGSSHIGGGGALARSRKENGKKLIVKIRNSAEHVNEHRPSYDANGMYLGEVYTNIDEASPTEVYYKKRSYLPLRLLEIFPNLWNDLVPAVRSVGFQKY